MANSAWAAGRAAAHNSRIPLGHHVRITRALTDEGTPVMTLEGTYEGQAVISDRARVRLRQWDVRFEGQNTSREDGVMILDVVPTFVEMKKAWPDAET